ncbi:MAG: cell division protein FtsZ, partial [Halolamina sp.]
YKGKVRVMAIMTGVQSAQVLGPTTQKQADRSRASIEGVEDADFDASQNVGSAGSFGASNSGNGRYGSTQSDGGRDEVEKNNGVDVIR